MLKTRKQRDEKMHIIDVDVKKFLVDRIYKQRVHFSCFLNFVEIVRNEKLLN